MSDNEQTKVALPGELAVAVFCLLGLEGLNKFDQDKLVDPFGSAAELFHGSWEAFRKTRLGGSGMDGVFTQLLYGGSLIRDGLSNTIRPALHTLGPYGQKVYEELSLKEQSRVREVVCWIVRDHRS